LLRPARFAGGAGLIATGSEYHRMSREFGRPETWFAFGDGKS
jgi:hypothetical protein